MKVCILRPMCFGGVRQEPGTSIEVTDLLGRELVAQGRAERADGGAPPPPGPLTTQSAAAVVKGKAASKEPPHVPQ